MIEEKLLVRIKAEFGLSLQDIHGLSHWQRVCENGLRLAESTGANRQIVELFAFLHDSKRVNNGIDDGHGRRAAAFIRTLQDDYLTLAPADLEDLVYACRCHTDGLVEANVTVQTCWDADRLDLGRVRIKPDPRYPCTSVAKQPEIIRWAYRRSRQGARKSTEKHRME